MACSGKSSSFSEFQEDLLIRAKNLTMPHYVLDSIAYSICFEDLVVVVDLIDHELLKEFLKVRLIKEHVLLNKSINKEKKDEDD